MEEKFFCRVYGTVWGSLVRHMCVEWGGGIGLSRTNEVKISRIIILCDTGTNSFQSRAKFIVLYYLSILFLFCLFC